MQNHHIEVYDSDEGAVLIASLIMITALMTVSLLCALVSSGVSGKEPRHIMTLERMPAVKRALMGNLWESGPGSGKRVFGSGGFIGDYGEPDSYTPFSPDTNFMGVLLDRESVSEWQRSSYDTDCHIWTGYRGDCYLTPPPDEKSGAPPYPGSYRDGWGHPLEVIFHEDSSEDRTILSIMSLGSDGIEGGQGEYREDIEESFYWKRPISLSVDLEFGSISIPDNTVVELEAVVIYPLNGIAATKIQTRSISINSGAGQGLYDFDLDNFPIGYHRLRMVTKTDLSSWGGPDQGSVIMADVLMIPPEPVTADPPGSPDSYEMSMACVL